jgi:preprotein translocase subunit YajC
MKKIFPLLMTLPVVAFAQDGAQGGGMYQTVIMIVLAMVFFYFILWRPEQKRRKAAEQMRTSLKKGDKVTAMGLLGTIVRVKDQTVILSLVEGAKVEILKAAITDVQSSSGEEAESSSES